MKVLPEELSVQLGSYPDGDVSKLRGQESALGGPANPRAGTRVNSEQASKVKEWTPTRLNNGEGRVVRARESVHAPELVRRGSGHGTQDKAIRVIGGGPSRARVATSNATLGVAVRLGVGQGHMSVDAG